MHHRTVRLPGNHSTQQSGQFKSLKVECEFEPPRRGQMLTVEWGFQPLPRKLSGLLSTITCLNPVKKAEIAATFILKYDKMIGCSYPEGGEIIYGSRCNSRNIADW